MSRAPQHRRGERESCQRPSSTAQGRGSGRRATSEDRGGRAGGQSQQPGADSRTATRDIGPMGGFDGSTRAQGRPRTMGCRSAATFPPAPARGLSLSCFTAPLRRPPPPPPPSPLPPNTFPSSLLLLHCTPAGSRPEGLRWLASRARPSFLLNGSVTLTGCGGPRWLASR